MNMTTDTGKLPMNSEQLYAALNYYDINGWTDGLPVMPVTESYLATFLAVSAREPEEVLFHIPHLNRSMTVRLAAINAALAGARPEYLPVVIAAWEAIAKEPHPVRGIWQSTTGTAPFLVVNGPIRNEIGLNYQGNIYGSGFRANATIGRAIRLGCINVFGLQPHGLDQATQGTPAKYSACIGENEEQSPWEPSHMANGFAPEDSVVTAYVIRSIMHIEARHSMMPEQLAEDLADSVRRTGALIHEYTSALLVLTPEHANLFAAADWSKDDVRQAVFERVVRSRSELDTAGKDAISHKSRWRLPAAHPDAMADTAAGSDTPDTVPLLSSPTSIQVMVAGANNAGVSSVVEVFTLNPPRLLPYSCARIGDQQ